MGLELSDMEGSSYLWFVLYIKRGIWGWLERESGFFRGVFNVPENSLFLRQVFIFLSVNKFRIISAADRERVCKSEEDSLWIW